MDVKIHYSYNVISFICYCIFCSVSDVVRLVTKKDIPPNKKMLELIPSFAEDEDCELVPTIKYLLF